MASSAPAVEPLVLRQRGLKGPMLADGPLVLALTAEERTRLRGQRQTRCGRKLLLQLTAELQRLGAAVVYADLSTLIISTGKRNMTAAVG